MTLAYYLKLYLASLAAFLLIDMLWLGVVARGFYRQHLGFLLSPRPNWAAAIVFYMLFVAGLLVFAVLPGLKAGAPGKAVALGAFFGLVAYATYDLTNLATIRGWPVLVTVVDMLWGLILAAIVSYVGFVVGQWLG